MRKRLGLTARDACSRVDNSIIYYVTREIIAILKSFTLVHAARLAAISKRLPFVLYNMYRAKKAMELYGYKG